MKGFTKKTLCVVLALAMVLGLGVSVFAANDVSSVKVTTSSKVDNAADDGNGTNYVTYGSSKWTAKNAAGDTVAEYTISARLEGTTTDVAVDDTSGGKEVAANTTDDKKVTLTVVFTKLDRDYTPTTITFGGTAMTKSEDLAAGTVTYTADATAATTLAFVIDLVKNTYGAEAASGSATHITLQTNSSKAAGSDLNTKVAYGADFYIDATAATNYQLTGLEVTGKVTGAKYFVQKVDSANIFTLKMPHEDIVIKATEGATNTTDVTYKTVNENTTYNATSAPYGDPNLSDGKVYAMPLKVPASTSSDKQTVTLYPVPEDGKGLDTLTVYAVATATATSVAKTYTIGNGITMNPDGTYTLTLDTETTSAQLYPVATWGTKTSQSGTELTGSGSFEGALSATVDVIVPTSANINFIVDPAQLVYATGGAAHSYTATNLQGQTIKIEPSVDSTATVLFRNATYIEDATGNAAFLSSIALSNYSDAMTVKNLSNTPVRVSANAIVDGDGTNAAGYMTLTDEIKSSSTDAELYLAIVRDTGATTNRYADETALASGANGVYVSYDLAALDNSYYDVVYSSSGGYETRVKAEDAVSNGSYPSVTYRLTGAANSNANSATWKEVQKGVPSVKIVWSVTQLAAVTETVDNTPSVALGGSTAINKKDLTTDDWSVNVTGATAITGIGFSQTSTGTPNAYTAGTGENAGKYYNANNVHVATVEGTKVTLTKAYFDSITSGDRYITITATPSSGTNTTAQIHVNFDS